MRGHVRAQMVCPYGRLGGLLSPATPQFLPFLSDEGGPGSALIIFTEFEDRPREGGPRPVLDHRTQSTATRVLRRISF